MTHNELTRAVEELEALVKTGSNYAQAETQARLLLASLGTSHFDKLSTPPHPSPSGEGVSLSFPLGEVSVERSRNGDGVSASFPVEEGRDGVNNETEIYCKVLLALSDVLWQRGLTQDALPFTQQVLAIAQHKQLRNLEARAANNIGIIYTLLSDYNSALKFYNRTLAIYKEMGQESGIARVTGNIGGFYLQLGNYNRALEYFSQALALHQALDEKSMIADATGNIGLAYQNLGDPVGALENYNRALATYEELGAKSRIANIKGNIGNVYNSLGDYNRALEYYGSALITHEELGEKSLIARVTGNIGNIYHQLGDYNRSLDYLSRTLTIAEEIGAKSNIARIMGHMGIVYSYQGDNTRALEYMNRALAGHKELGENVSVASNLGNIGLVYHKLGDLPRALLYYRRALAGYEELDNKSGIALFKGNIGSLYSQTEFEGYDPIKAEEYLIHAISVFEELGAKKELYEFEKLLADILEKQERWKEHSLHYKKYHELIQEVQSEETKQKAEQLDYERKTAEREKQLAVERAEAATIKRILHNTLPPIIAKRLINNETFIADNYPGVSVLFMDLVNFTRIAAHIPPRHLIYLLNTIFSHADAVMEKHGLEKIKTIGDAYMAVAGAPVHQDDHAIRAALAALDVLDIMNNLSLSIPQELGNTAWTDQIGEIYIRIGLHCGEAIGGVIGEKKFTFDLWGDAVNTASRMESHGEAGRIHVSEEFAKHLSPTLSQNLTQTLSKGEGLPVSFPLGEGRDGVSFSFPLGEGRDGVLLPRGEIEIKGKGKMKTYFLERA
jgi:class 3 adenylate cyclase/tetratricopeptide (TPR) repeat protein